MSNKTNDKAELATIGMSHQDSLWCRKRRMESSDIMTQGHLINRVTKTRKRTNGQDATPYVYNTSTKAAPLTDITSRDYCSFDQSNRRDTGSDAKYRSGVRRGCSQVTGNPVVIDLEEPESGKHEETVTYVNNLFSPVNKLQAIPMTLKELQRRTEYPEFFGRSQLVAYLRHSKTTGNELISKFDLRPAKCRSNVNVLSRLCEHEALTLANGIHTVNTEYFPSAYVADTMTNMMKEGEEEEAKETVSNTIDLLQDLKGLLKSPKDSELAEDLNVFEKVTHTFGCQNIVNHINFIEGFLEKLKTKL